MGIVSVASLAEVTAPRDYPYLGVNRGDKTIVLFWTRNAGVVIKSGISKYKIGHTALTWLEGNFDIYGGAVELKNT